MITGCMSEGIYRRSGSNSSVTKLLSLFRQDSWSVQIGRQEYTEYDVANVLKRFFRDLPEPLLTTQLHKHLCNAPGKFGNTWHVNGELIRHSELIANLCYGFFLSAVNCSEEDKLSLYRNILEQLQPVNYVTVRKLIGHLYFIHQQHDKNLMPVGNLAAIWGPTLMHVEVRVDEKLTSESTVYVDLITFFTFFMLSRRICFRLCK